MNLYQYLESLSGKTVVMYHGLGGNKSSDRKRILAKMGVTLLQETHDYKKEYEKDKGESFMKEQELKIGQANVIMGISFGGYVAYLLASKAQKPLILINPAINRAVSTTSIKNFEYETNGLKSPKIEVFYGEKDTNVLVNDQKKILGEKCQYIEIKEMAHRVPNTFFQEICNKSKILNS